MILWCCTESNITVNSSINDINLLMSQIFYKMPENYNIFFIREIAALTVLIKHIFWRGKTVDILSDMKEEVGPFFSKFKGT